MEVVEPNNKGIEIAAKKILKGEIIFIPTDTVYGIAANPFSNKAINKLFLIKKRSKKNYLILLCSNYKMAQKYAIFNKIAKNFKKEFWPGPMTLILERRKKLGIRKKWLNKNNSIGIRIPDHNIAKRIINKCNIPIFCTSANLSGKKSSKSLDDVIRNFKNKEITIIKNDKTNINRKESVILDLTKNKIKILRNGPLNKKKYYKLSNNGSKN